MKQNKLLYAIVISLAFIFSNKSFSQTNSDDWTFVADSLNVKFYFKTVQCENSETILYKISSSNTSVVTMNWIVWGQGPIENVTVNSGETQEGSCTANKNLTLTVPPGAVIVNNALPIKFTVFK